MGALLAAVYPDKGTVCFSAGLHGWAFTLTVFAKLYAKKVGVTQAVRLHWHAYPHVFKRRKERQGPFCRISMLTLVCMCSLAWLRTR